MDRRRNRIDNRNDTTFADLFSSPTIAPIIQVCYMYIYIYNITEYHIGQYHFQILEYIEHTADWRRKTQQTATKSVVEMI
jgi:hypothetical protein